MFDEGTARTCMRTHAGCRDSTAAAAAAAASADAAAVCGCHVSRMHHSLANTVEVVAAGRTGLSRRRRVRNSRRTAAAAARRVVFLTSPTGMGFLHPRRSPGVSRRLTLTARCTVDTAQGADSALNAVLDGPASIASTRRIEKDYVKSMSING